MSNDCLVTKLKGEVQNDNLPKLGIASFDIKKSSSNIAFQIASPTVAVHVKSKMPFTPYGSSVKVYEYTTTPGVSVYGTIANSDIPGNVGDIITDAIECDNMYALNLMYIATGGQHVMTIRNNLKSTYKYAPIEIASINKDDAGLEFNDALYYINIEGGDSYSDNTNGDEYLEITTIESIRCSNAGGFNIANNHNANTHVKYIFASSVGYLTDLPLNLEFIYATSIKGEIVDFVDHLRGLGRTSGFITLGSIHYSIVTYNGTQVRTLVENNTIHNFDDTGMTTILTWDANSITWATEVPEGAVINTIMPSIYYAQKHSA